MTSEAVMGASDDVVTTSPTTSSEAGAAVCQQSLSSERAELSKLPGGPVV